MRIIHQNSFERWDIPDKSVQAIVTSPPYWALRRYEIPDIVISGWKGQYGEEPDFRLFIEHTRLWAKEAWRVLRNDGVMFLNFGDSYSTQSGGMAQGKYGKLDCDEIGKIKQPKVDLPSKCKLLIPHRIAIALMEDDSNDIYELDKRYILCNNITITEDISNAIQRQREREKVFQGICEKMESKTSNGIQNSDEKVGKRKSSENKELQKEVLLDTQRERDNASYQSECETTQEIKIRCIDLLWRQSSEMQMLPRKQNTIFDNRSYQWRWSETQKENKAFWFNLRMVKKKEISKRLQDFMYELQFGKRLLWFLPPSGRKNFRFRKSDIPKEIINCFNLEREERWRLRNDLIWFKPNAMPESVTDRFSKRYEYIFMFSKQERYYFDLDAVREEHQQTTIERLNRGVSENNKWKDGPNGQSPHNLSKPRPNVNSPEYAEWYFKQREKKDWKSKGEKIRYTEGNRKDVKNLPYPKGKNPGDVWRIATQPFGKIKFLGDYDGIDGKPYKASLDCPIYEHRLYAEKKQKGQYDGQPNFERRNNFGNDKNPYQEQIGESSSIPILYVYQKENECFSEPKVANIETHKISGEDEANSQNLLHNKRKNEIPVSISDFADQKDSVIAISHNKKIHKKDPASLSYQANIFSSEKSDGIADKLTEHEKIEHISHIDGNNISVDSVLDEKAINEEEKILSDISNISYKNNNKNKCICQVISDAHYAMFPEKLVERMIRCSTKRGDVVLDPFCGSGTTIKVAETLGRQGTGIDLGYKEIQERRLSVIEPVLI